jgi:hypothetical protein
MIRISLEVTGGEVVTKAEATEDATKEEYVLAAIYQTEISKMLESPAVVVLTSMAVDETVMLIHGEERTLADLISLGLANTDMLQQKFDS